VSALSTTVFADEKSAISHAISERGRRLLTHTVYSFDEYWYVFSSQSTPPDRIADNPKHEVSL